MDSSLASRYREVIAEIDEAARQADRDPADITTIVVTKFHPASVVHDLYDFGVRNVGENRHQEAVEKHAECTQLSDLTWHFIGQLQSNKARAVREYASVVHSVDRSSLVTALSLNDDEAGAGAPPLDCFLQLNLTDNPQRGGVSDDGLLPLAELVLAQPSLRLLGVMAVAPLDEAPAAAFERVRRASERIQTVAPLADKISTGMSHDFREAISAGATHLRIGSAITGERAVAG